MIQPAVDRLVELVEHSGLVESEALSAAVAAWSAQQRDDRPGDARQLGEQLVREGLLTAWQCQKLLDGRHRGFMLGNYKLLDHLGSGGMSNVYLAEHMLMQRRVAIKVLPQNRVADASFLARFLFEGQAVAALDHQNIVRAYDLGCQGRIHYLVMEFVDGSDLEVLVRRSGPLGFSTAANYIAQAAAGLDHAHQCGLVHRDVKPANLLVDRHEGVKILDMGLAKFKAEVRPAPAFAREDEVLGTAEYLAPEQAVNSLAVDHRADIYGLGCTLYFLLTGHPPFDGRTPVELMAAHRQRPTPSIVAERSDVPQPLEAICQKMMTKSPDERFQTAREVFEALAVWLEAERAAGRATAAQAELTGIRGAATHPPELDLPAALRETRADLQDTAKIDPSRTSSGNPASDVLLPRDEKAPTSESARGSDVLLPPPPTPPVVSPPRQSPHAPIPTVVPRRQAPPSSAEQAVIVRAARPQVAARSSAQVPRPARFGAIAWLWTFVLSALVLAAVFAALFAFVN